VAGVPKPYWAVYKTSNGQYTKTLLDSTKTAPNNMPKIHWPLYHNHTREHTKIPTASILKHHWTIYQNPTSQHTINPLGNILLQSIPKRHWPV
jgi:hypothetical protein